MARPGSAKRVSAAASAERVRARISGAIRRIPRGRVATYGQIAALAGIARQPRRVGQTLRTLPAGSSVPWHRVVSAGGVLGLGRYDAMAGWEQRVRLEQEGVRFGRQGRVSLEEFGWKQRRT
jgi:methylated-DNA-protein-cysteine methyltransferase related protein